MVQCANKIGGIGLWDVPNELRRDKGRKGYPEAEGHHLRSAGDTAGHTGVAIADISVNERVHAGELEGGEKNLRETQGEDTPDGGAGSDQREKQDRGAKENGIRDQHLAVAEAGEN